MGAEGETKSEEAEPPASEAEPAAAEEAAAVDVDAANANIDEELRKEAAEALAAAEEAERKEKEEAERKELEKESGMVEKVLTKRKKRKEVFNLKSTWLNPEDFVPPKEYIELRAERLRNLTEADEVRFSPKKRRTSWRASFC